MRRHVLYCTVCTTVLLLASPMLAVAKPLYQSKTVTSETTGGVEIDVDITGAEQLFLVITDAGDGNSCDWADWAEPRLIGPQGEKKLTELKWKSAATDWGRVDVNRNADGAPLVSAGVAIPYGIGAHANSVIEYDLPKGYTRFKARGLLDEGGTSQGHGCTVQFAVYSKKPPIGVAPPRGPQGSHAPADAVANLDVGEGLTATLSASEPDIVSLTNLDIDSRGRVWVCEVVNYRGNNGRRPEGDRILILEDTDRDGVMDDQKVYYQGRDIDSAVGLCVLGNKTIVSCSPNIWLFTDTNGDDKPDSKELLFSKVGQPQHDHSAHSFTFGPDGKLYWNFGNTGRAVHDKEGKIVVDKAGNEVRDNGKPYFGGMVFRCNLDGSEMETLGHNFRNNYEVAVDSFGTLWQSDNDDDGNRGVRINYVMEYGNFGYLEEGTGQGWQAKRTNIEKEIPLRHWHLNDPGVVPNLLQTGAGSPTGITVYEGELLPEVFRNQMIHADAGPNVVRAYPVSSAGAGYAATTENILLGTRDNWFRPADVAVAPDGSLFVSDWYDPGVGGHGQGDLDRGRLFRIATESAAKYTIPKVDCSTIEGAIEALKNPCNAVRYDAWMALHAKGEDAEPALKKMFETSENARHRARALWLLGKIEGRAQHWVDVAAADDDANIRIVSIRLARQTNADVAKLAENLSKDKSPPVRRDVAIALRHLESPVVPNVWAELAAQHDGQDRWYLEALGIGAEGRWDECLAAWQAKVGDQWNNTAGRDIVWRSRAKQTPKLLAEIVLASDPQEHPRYMRAFDFLSGPEKDAALRKILGF
ncbi:MAG: PVC-type heme-binding CxxCH protein [Pirellulales bacterium]